MDFQRFGENDEHEPQRDAPKSCQREDCYSPHTFYADLGVWSARFAFFLFRVRRHLPTYGCEVHSRLGSHCAGKVEENLAATIIGEMAKSVVARSIPRVAEYQAQLSCSLAALFIRCNIMTTMAMTPKW